MSFDMDVKVRYSECTRAQKVSLHMILNYMQDAATLHSEVIGYGLERNLSNHNGWFLLAYDIEIRRLPEVFEEITVSTDPYLMKGYYGYRSFDFLDRQGNVLIHADSMWILMDIEKLLPVRVPAEMTQGFGASDGGIKPTIKRKIRAGKEWEAAASIPVMAFYLDTNGHVNNQYYGMWAEGFLEEDRQLSGVKIDYRKSAVEGDRIEVFTQDTDKGRIIKFENQDEELLAYVKFTFAQEETDTEEQDKSK